MEEGESGCVRRRSKIRGVQQSVGKKKESVQSELETCKSDKTTTESKLHKCTTEKEAAEKALHQCSLDKGQVTAELHKTVAACSEADERVQTLKAEVTKAKSAREEARMEVICVREEANANIKQAQEEAAKNVKAAEQDAEERVKLAHADAEKQIEAALQETDTKLKQAKDEADKATSAQKEAEKNVESNRQDFVKTLASAQEEAQERLESANQQAKKQFESAQEEANEAAKLAQEEVEKNIDSVKKAAETKLNDIITTYQQREKQIQDELSTAKTTIDYLQPYKDDAGKQSEKVVKLQNELSDEQKARRQDKNSLDEKHNAELEEVMEKHIDEVERLQGEQEETLQKLVDKHQHDLQDLKGEANDYVATKINLSSAKDAKEEAEQKTEFVRQQLNQLQHATNDYDVMKAENKKLNSHKTALQSQLKETRIELQAKLQGVEAQLESANAQHQSTESSLQAQLEQVTESMSRMEAANKDLSQEVSVLQEKTTSQAESTVANDNSIRLLQDENEELSKFKQDVTTELQSMKSSLEKAERTNEDNKQDQQTTAVEKKKKKQRKHRRKHRNGRYSTDLPDDTDVDKSDTESVDLPMAQSVHQLVPQLVPQPLGSPLEEQVEEVAEELSKLAFDEDPAANDGPALKAVKSDASDSSSSSTLSDFLSLPNIASFVPAKNAQLANTESTEQSEANSARARPDSTPAEESAHKQKMIKEDPKNMEKGPAQGPGVEKHLNSSSVTSTPKVESEREAALTPSMVSATCESLAKENDSAASLPDQRPVLDASKGIQDEAKNTRDARANDEAATNLAKVAEWGTTKIAFRTPREDQKSLQPIIDEVVDPALLALPSIDASQAVDVPLPEERPFECLDLSKTKGHTVLPNRKTVNPTKDERRAQKAKGKPTAEGPANTSHGKSKPSSASDAATITSPPRPVASSTTEASQCVNAGPTTSTGETELHKPKSGRPDFVTEELAAQRAEDLKKSMWASQTSATTESPSGQTSVPYKAAQIFKSCIDDAKGNEAGKDLQSSRWASVASEVKTPVGTPASPPQQTVPPTTQSGKIIPSATAASKAMPPAGASIAAKAPRPADPASVALGAATLPPATASPVAASITGASAAPARTATAPVISASGSVPGPVRAIQYSSSAHSANARPTDIPQRGRGTGIGSGRGRGRGGGGRGGRGRGRAMIENHKVADWLTIDLAKKAEEARTSPTAP